MHPDAGAKRSRVMNHPKPDSQLEALVAAYLDGRLSDEDW